MAEPRSDRTAVDVLAEMVAIFDSGNLDAVSEFVSESYVDHQGLGNGPMYGVQGFSEVVRASHAGFEHKQVTILDSFGAQDRAVARIRWQGLRSNGDELDRKTIDIVRVVEGMAVEHWGAHS